MSAVPKNWHKHLWKIVQCLPTDFEPYGKRSREKDWGLDCSCGCKWFLKLEGELRFDWGVCSNPKSPRAGLLTFEHMGCKKFGEDRQSDIDLPADSIILRLKRPTKR